MPSNSLQMNSECVTLGVGDMIRDARSGSLGFLTLRERRVDIVLDDVYVWWVEWFKPSKNQFVDLPFLDEDCLADSIEAGTISIYKAEDL